jgi:uncharacterized membrane protein YccF (DUF307 family)
MGNTQQKRRVPPAQDAMTGDPTRKAASRAPRFSVPWQQLLEETMRLILNVIWLIFGGLWLALGYLLIALVCFLCIVTIPFGFAALRIASYALWPFGRTVVDKPGAGTGALIGNIIWLVLFGIGIAIAHVVTAVAMALTIIGIPLALANLKLVPVMLLPLGKEIVPTVPAGHSIRPPSVRV